MLFVDRGCYMRRVCCGGFLVGDGLGATQARLRERAVVAGGEAAGNTVDGGDGSSAEQRSDQRDTPATARSDNRLNLGLSPPLAKVLDGLRSGWRGFAGERSAFRPLASSSVGNFGILERYAKCSSPSWKHQPLPTGDSSWTSLNGQAAVIDGEQRRALLALLITANSLDLTLDNHLTSSEKSRFARVVGIDFRKNERLASFRTTSAGRMRTCD